MLSLVDVLNGASSCLHLIVKSNSVGYNKGMSKVESIAFLIPNMILKTRLKFSCAGCIIFTLSGMLERSFLPFKI